MLQEFQRLHEQILALLAQLEHMASEPAPPPGLASLRFRLTSLSRSRTRLLEGRLYSRVAQHASPAQLRALRQLRADGKEELALSARHIMTWDMPAIEARWSDYCRASRAMRAQMRRRIKAEQDILYPLLAGGSR